MRINKIDICIIGVMWFILVYCTFVFLMLNTAAIEYGYTPQNFFFTLLFDMVIIAVFIGMSGEIHHILENIEV